MTLNLRRAACLLLAVSAFTFPACEPAPPLIPPSEGKKKAGSTATPKDDEASPEKTGHSTERNLTSDGRDRSAAWVPFIEPASDEAREAMKGMKYDSVYVMELVAANPDLANPVGMDVDRHGHIYVAECFRRVDGGGEDNRDHVYWQADDMAAQRVEDREAYVLKHHPEYAEKFTWGSDQVRRLVDRDGDGVVDESTVFASGFDDLVDGPATDVFCFDDKVWFTNIPHLWELKDEDGDGVAEKKRSLQNGFGVRYALFGHDLHGMRRGPDGRIYFSIGDRGYHLETADGRLLHDPESGAVFRCEPDGSRLEIFATGLRNPQDLAFDDYGNLITCDNNSDSDDKARVVYVVEGGITGWRMNFQYLPRRGPWVREGWWQTRDKNEGKFLIPPLAHLGHGPSGLEFDRGTGTPERHRGCFFLCDFLGGRGGSGIRSFRLAPDGAGMKFLGADWLMKNCLPTDVVYGPDGAFYFCDWVATWAGCGKGRIYRMRAEKALAEKSAQEAAQWLKEDFRPLESTVLASRLKHANRQVRLEAQWALAAKDDALARFREAVGAGKTRLERLHGVWGLGQLARRNRTPLTTLKTLCSDSDLEVAGQAAKVLGEAQGGAEAVEELRRLLRASAAELKASSDRSRAAFFAAISLGTLDAAEAVGDLEALLATNDDHDLYLRHAAVMGLRAAPVATLAGWKNHESDAVRLGAVLALRRRNAEEVALFLDDKNDEIAVEAARAIYDHPVESAMPVLAGRGRDPRMKKPAFARRVLGAAQRLGRVADLATLVTFAANDRNESSLRCQALDCLVAWRQGGQRDSVLNVYQLGAAREEAPVVTALAPSLSKLTSSTNKDIRRRLATLAEQYRLNAAAPALKAWALDDKSPVGLRRRYLAALGATDLAAFAEVAEKFLASPEAALRADAARRLAKADPERGVPLLLAAMERGQLAEMKPCLDALAEIADPRAEAAVDAWIRKLSEGEVTSALRLEVLEAAEKVAARGSATVKTSLASYRATLEPTDSLAPYATCLEGGDAKRGERVFRRSELSCERCHARKEKSAAKVGPTLYGIADIRSASSLLESIVLPDRSVTEGYQMVQVELQGGDTVVGRYLGEDADAIRLEISEDDRIIEVRSVKKSLITGRRDSGSAMTKDLAEKMSRRDLRDLISYLRTLKKTAPKDR